MNRLLVILPTPLTTHSTHAGGLSRPARAASAGARPIHHPSLIAYSTLMFSTGVTADGHESSRLSSISSSSCARLRVW